LHFSLQTQKRPRFQYLIPNNHQIFSSCEFKNDVLINIGQIHDFGTQSGVVYNEYVVYNPNQIKMRYVVKVRFVPKQRTVIPRPLQLSSGNAQNRPTTTNDGLTPFERNERRLLNQLLNGW
jgi:hypothetical protein